MKKAVVSFIIVSFSIPGIAQPSDTNSNNSSEKKSRTLQGNSIYIEICGNATFAASLNYERMVVHSKKFYMTGRFGFGAGQYIYNTTFIAMPLLLNFQYQLTDIFIIECGAGATLSFVPQEKRWYPFITGLAGVRVQTKKGFLFRAGFTPVYNLHPDFQTFEEFLPWGGISLGYGFGK